jgi:hypothetical protein
MTAFSTKTSLNELRRRLRAMFALQDAGAGYDLVRARGAVDGYMAALVDSGAVSEAELLALVSEERRRFRGPGFGLFARGDEVTPGPAPRAARSLAVT